MVVRNTSARKFPQLTAPGGVLHPTHASNYLHPCRIRVLKRNSLDFWDPSVRLTGDITTLFRNTLVQQATTQVISWETAKAYLAEAFQLCRFWRQTGEPELGGYVRQRSRGFLSHTFVTVVKTPPVWTIKAPPSHEPPIPNGLALEVIADIRLYLRDTCRPVKPAVLRSKPRADWSEKRRRAYEKAKSSYTYRQALYLRNLAVFELMLASGARLAEFPLLMKEDASSRSPEPEEEPDDRRIWLTFRRRAATRHLGSLKTGARSVYIGFLPEAVDALQGWLRMGRPLVMARAAERGLSTHELLLTNDDGRPLTQGAIRALCLKIRRHLEGLYAVTGEEGVYAVPGDVKRTRVKLHPHQLRHTIESILLSGGVPLDIRQAHLGHKRPDTTHGYGRLYDGAAEASLDRLQRHNAEHMEHP